MAGTFPYPVGLLAFNRPDYLTQVLESLARQAMTIDPGRVTVHLDAFTGSGDEAVGRADATGDVADAVARVLSGATVVSAERNVGIARAYDVVETALFADESARWVVFLEDDMVLDPRYLETLSRVIDEADPYPQVAAVSASGDCYVDRARGEQTYYPMHFAWGCAVRRSHWVASRPYLDAYLAALGDSRYGERDHDAVYAALAPLGVFPVWSAQDAVKEAIRRRLNRLAVTTGLPYGHYVGEVGETFTPELFAARGFADRSAPQPQAAWEVPFTTQALACVADEAEVSFAQRATRNLVVGRTRDRQRISRLLERVERLQDRVQELRSRRAD